MTPAPLIPADVDLRDFQYMPLDVVRLRDSSMVAKRTSDEIVAGMLLWCASWHQVPAASLPDDDAELAQLAGFGRGPGGVRDFKKVRVGALHGLVLCSDGRFYHTVVAEKAADAWNSKLRDGWRRACDNARKQERPPPPKPRFLIFQPQGDIPSWSYEEFPPNSDGIGRRNSRRKGKGEGKGTERERNSVGVASQPLPGVPPGDAHGPGLNGYPAEARALLNFLNDRSGKRFPPSDSNVGIIVARLREGFTATQIRQVIAAKVREWNADEEMRKYLRPETLFRRSKFSNYVGELVPTPPETESQGEPS